MKDVTNSRIFLVFVAIITVGACIGTLIGVLLTHTKSQGQPSAQNNDSPSETRERQEDISLRVNPPSDYKQRHEAGVSLREPKKIKDESSYQQKPLRKWAFTRMNQEEALDNSRFPEEYLAKMEVIDVPYTNFLGEKCFGQLVVDGDLAEEVVRIFEEIEESGFPIEKIVPISAYEWSDSASVKDNNTSAFNYRKAIIPGRKTSHLSKHAYGRAIDINPFQNPFVVHGVTRRKYDPAVRGTLTADSPPVKIFEKYGWEWGGSWDYGKDYQHFEKKVPPGWLD